MNDDQTPKKPGDRRISGSYRLDVPREVLLKILSQCRAAHAAGPYTREMALLSLLLDTDAGTLKSHRDYQRLWGWSKGDIGRKLPLLRGEVAAWLNPNAGKPLEVGAKVGQNWGSNGAINGESVREAPKAGAELGQDWGKAGALTIQPQPTTLQKEEEREGGTEAQAPARSQPRPPKGKVSEGRPKSHDAVRALWAKRGYIGGDEEAEAFANWFDANGWLIGKAKTPCKDWTAAAATWNGRNKQRNGDYGRANGSTGRPVSGGASPARDPGKELFERAKQAAQRRRGHTTGGHVPNGSGRADDPVDIDGRTPVEPRR